MIIWCIVILIALFALIVLVNRKRGPEERSEDYWGLFDLRRPPEDLKKPMQQEDEQEKP